jgi:L-ribulose-5-phosphate 4-epimerase
MLELLKQSVWQANRDLVKHGLVVLTWGNASALDQRSKWVVIKPSGIGYDTVQPGDMVIVDLDGKVVEGKWAPSSDTATHLELYRAFPSIGAVVHTHSTYATAWAQAGREIPNIGTTQADYFRDTIPCTRDLSVDEIEADYEAATGRVIVERLQELDPMHTPGVLVKNHGPFAWGKTPNEAVYHAVVVEQVAKMAFVSTLLNPDLTMNPALIEKHFSRKHGAGAYYGQGRGR